MALGSLQDATVLAWWDYGHAITALGERTSFVDAAGLNDTHVARVAQALLSPGALAYGGAAAAAGSRRVLAAVAVGARASAGVSTWVNLAGTPGSRVIAAGGGRLQGPPPSCLWG